MRLQSSVEFLATYGWAVLIIIVILSALYLIGAFNGQSALANVCIPTPGFSCTSPVLYASSTLAGYGTLAANLSISKSLATSITVTGLACTRNSTTPSFQTFNSPPQGNAVVVTPSNPQQFYFVCPLPSNSIGTVFAGYLWITYNTPTISNQIAEFGSVTVHVSGVLPPPITVGTTTSSTVSTTTSSTSKSSLTTSIKTTSTTSTVSPTTSTEATTVPYLYASVPGPLPAEFQLLVYVNSSSYGSQLRSDDGNIRFYQGSNELFSWCESNCVSSAKNTIFWVKLGTPIPFGNTLSLRMDPLSTGTDYQLPYAGEAPQLSSTYAQYDNGANVFAIYFDGLTPGSEFNAPGEGYGTYYGTSPPLTMTTNTAANYNGKTIDALNAYGSTQGNPTSQETWYGFVFDNTYINNQPVIAEANFQNLAYGYGFSPVGLVNSPSEVTASRGTFTGFGGAACGYSPFCANYMWTGCLIGADFYWGNNGPCGTWYIGTYNGTQDGNWTYSSMTYYGNQTNYWSGYDTPKLYPLGPNGNTLSSNGYSNTVYDNPLAPAPTLYFGTAWQECYWYCYNQWWSVNYNWGRVRLMPPDDMMPYVKFTGPVANSCPTNPIYYIPVTITNNQPSSTGSNFQQMIEFNPGQYISNPCIQGHIDSTLSNIRFLQGKTALYSWCESNCTVTANQTLFWVKIPGGIPASGSVTMNLTIEPTSINYDPVAGEAPQFTGIYGAYDNGASVFQFYDNFAGGVLSTKWLQNEQGNYTVLLSNGLSIKAELAGETGEYMLYSKQTFGPGIVAETMFTQFQGVDGVPGGIRTANPALISNTSLDYIAESTPAPTNVIDWSINDGGTANWATEQLQQGTTCPYSNWWQDSIGSDYEINITKQVWGLTYTGGTNYFYWNNYTLFTSNSLCSPGGTNAMHLALGTYYQNLGGEDGLNMEYFWARIRTFPPNGAMPTVSFASVQTGGQTTTSTTTSTTTTITAATPYIQITLHNSQGTPTNAPFQQMIVLNASKYSAYESQDLGNLRFYNSIAPVSGTANELYSWCEFGCSSTATNATFWVRLPSAIPGNSNVIVNLSFQTVGIEYDDNFAGANPQLKIQPSYHSDSVSASTAVATDNDMVSANSLDIINISPGSGNLYLCAAASGSSTDFEGGPYSVALNHTSYISDANTSYYGYGLGSAYIGHQTSNTPCYSDVMAGYDYYGGGYPQIASLVAAGIGITTQSNYKYYLYTTNETNGYGYGSTDIANLTFTVPTTSFVALVASCGSYAGCDTIVIPSGCTKQVELNDTNSTYGGPIATVYIATCTTLGAGKYLFSASNTTSYEGTIALAAYVFANVTYLNYGEFDNGQNVFLNYFNGNTNPSLFNHVSGLTVFQGNAIPYGSTAINAISIIGYGGSGQPDVVYSGNYVTNRPVIAESNFENNANFTDLGAVGIMNNAVPTSVTNAISVESGQGSGFFAYGFDTYGSTEMGQNQEGFDILPYTWNYANASYHGTGATNWGAYDGPTLEQNFFGTLVNSSVSGCGNINCANPLTGSNNNLYLGLMGNAWTATTRYWAENINWMLMRSYPPNGIMPTVTLGSLQ